MDVQPSRYAAEGSYLAELQDLLDRWVRQVEVPLSEAALWELVRETEDTLWKP